MAAVTAPPDQLDLTARLEWRAPCLVRYHYAAGPRVYNTNLYAVPTAPGRSRVFLRDASYAAPSVGAVAGAGTPHPASQRLPLVAKLRRILVLFIFRAMPVWFLHDRQGTIFDGDGARVGSGVERCGSVCSFASETIAPSHAPIRQAYF